MDSNDLDIARLLKLLGLPPEAMHQLAAVLQQAPSPQAHGVDPHAEAVVAECHQGTWFETRGLASITETYRGTRPGDPFGDVLFGFLYADTTTRIRIKVKNESLDVPIGAAEDAWTTSQRDLSSASSISRTRTTASTSYARLPT